MSIRARVRALLPNVQMTIRHIEPDTRLRVRLRHHAGLILHGSAAYEPRYVRVFRALIHDGCCVLDIGANIGFYTLLFSRLAGERGRVVAYEPDPDNLELLSTNLLTNRCRNATVRAVALASASGQRSFSRDTVTGFTGRLGTDVTYAQSLTGSSRVVVTEVETRTLDEETAELGLTPDVVKIDVEGFEYEVLQGGRTLFQRARPVVIAELSGDFAEGTKGRAIDVLRELNYTLWNLDTGRLVAHDEKAWMVLALPTELPAQHVAPVLAQLENSTTAQTIG